MGNQPIPPPPSRRPPTAEEHVRACYIEGLIDFEKFDRALQEIIVEGRAGVPAYVPPRDPGRPQRTNHPQTIRR